LVPLAVGARAQLGSARGSRATRPAEAPPNNDSMADAISANGRIVAFDSKASNLVAGDTVRCPSTTRKAALINCPDVFVADMSGTVERVSLSSTGAQANDQSWTAALSASGRYVAFASDASNLVPGDTNGRADVFVFDRVSKKTTRVNVSSSGAQADGGF